MNPERQGTKAAAHYRLMVGPRESATVRLRLTGQAAARKSGKAKTTPSSFGAEFDKTLATRLQQADQFYRSVTPPSVPPDAANVMRQAIAGMLWSKQFYFFDGDSWLDEHRSNPLHTGYRASRNSGWFHRLNEDIISMPDKWEYPWYAAWDLAFHTLPLSIVDPDFAKQQLELMLQGVYLHPSGQIPAYEWNFSDVPPGTRLCDPVPAPHHGREVRGALLLHRQGYEPARSGGMWDEEDGFYYDLLRLPDGTATRLKVRSMVGLLPLCATTVIEAWQRERVPRAMAQIFERHRRMPELMASIHPTGAGHFGVAERGIVALLNPERLRRILTKMLDENEFLNPYGIRSLSKFHEQHPYIFLVQGQEYRVDYLPAESNTGMFGGNSNWRGPVWIPVNAMIIRALLNFYLLSLLETWSADFTRASGFEESRGVTRRTSHPH